MLKSRMGNQKMLILKTQLLSDVLIIFVFVAALQVMASEIVNLLF